MSFRRAPNELIQNGITEQELATAQDYLTGNLVFEFQSNVNVAQFLLATELYDLGQDYAQRYPEIVRGITCEEVHRVARQYLDTVHYATVVVGPTHEKKTRQPVINSRLIDPAIPC